MPLLRAILPVCLLLLAWLPCPLVGQAAPAETKAAAPKDEAAEKAAAEKARAEKVKAMVERLKAMKPLEGKVPLAEPKATLNLKPEYKFLGPADAEYVLCDIWRNPKEVVRGVQGIIVPAGFNPLRGEAWCVVVSFDKCGYVKDDDAAEIDAKKLLEAFHEHEEEINEARKKRGYDELWCVDWAEAPHYDKARHIIFWAKRLSDERKGTDNDSLNYDARCLGRRGLLSLNAVASLKQLPEIKTAMESVIAQANFDEGETYADFNSSTDHVAEYTVLGIVAAGAAAKLLGKGAFLVVLLKFGKFLIIPFIAGWKYIVSGSRWVWGKVTGRTPAPAPIAATPTELPPAADDAGKTTEPPKDPPSA